MREEDGTGSGGLWSCQRKEARPRNIRNIYVNYQCNNYLSLHIERKDMKEEREEVLKTHLAQCYADF